MYLISFNLSQQQRTSLFPYTTLFRSSGLATHADLGWPDDTEDLRYFYPTADMQMGYDIMFFWCARMIMLDRKSTRLNSSHLVISYAVFCLKKKKTKRNC